ncbi:hypothetical protein WH79_07685, partial [Streptococcus dysgalactiae subsp. equisimilis]
ARHPFLFQIVEWFDEYLQWIYLLEVLVHLITEWQANYFLVFVQWLVEPPQLYDSKPGVHLRFEVLD